jgi:hypothetical protein
MPGSQACGLRAFTLLVAVGCIRESCALVPNLMSLKVRCAPIRLTLCTRVVIFDRFRELNLAYL